MKVIDSFIFYNELDLLLYRLTILDPYVDYFVLVESTRTFSGETKPLFYEQNRELFKKFTNKIVHVVVDDSPIQTKVHDDRAWKNESFQRDCIKRGIDYLSPSLSDEDCIFTSDLDEICDPERLKELRAICKHENKIEVNYSYRVGASGLADVCEYCGSFLGYKGNPTI